MESSIFAKNLRFYRKKAGLTQSDLGKESGIGQVSIANYEKGIRFPDEKTMKSLAENLGITLDILFYEVTQKTGFSLKSSFSISELVDLTLNDSFNNCLRYVNGWTKMEDYNLYQIYSEIVIPVLQETGNKWQQGTLSVSEEHLISERMRELISLVSVSEYQDSQPAKVKENVWIGFCAPSDKHDMVIYMLYHLLRNRGWKSYFLGTDIPVNDLSEMIIRYRASAISVSVMMDLFRSGLDAYLQHMDDNMYLNCPIIVSGEGADKGIELQYKKVKNYASTFDEAYRYVIELEK